MQAATVAELKSHFAAEHHAVIDYLAAQPGVNLAVIDYLAAQPGVNLGTILTWLNGPQGQLLLGVLGGLIGKLGSQPTTGS